MSRIHTTEALVLKAYDVGDADRFCILLTESNGRVTAIAKGVRKLGSRLAGSVQSFQHLRVDLAEHSSGFYLQSAECLASFDHIRLDLPRFFLASRAAELLLHFLHDTEPQSSIFTLAREFFEECDTKGNDVLFSTFQLILLEELGFLPSFSAELRHAEQAPQRASTPLDLRSRSAQHDVSGAVSKHLARVSLPSPLLCSYLLSKESFLKRSSMNLSVEDQKQVRILCDTLLQDHLSFPMKSNRVISAVS